MLVQHIFSPGAAPSRWAVNHGQSTSSVEVCLMQGVALTHIGALLPGSRARDHLVPLRCCLRITKYSHCVQPGLVFVANAVMVNLFVSLRGPRGKAWAT